LNQERELLETPKNVYMDEENLENIDFSLAVEY
jgi:hypothetical protein